MTLSAERRRRVRQRAHFACEFCGVTETDVGGELTVDHFCPRARGGADQLDNLVYCCVRCNQYKADYWPVASDEPALWNPRREPMQAHFLTLVDGTLYPITAAGTFTLKRLRLNRPPLVAYRLQKHHQTEEQRLLLRYRTVMLAAAVVSSSYGEESEISVVVGDATIEMIWIEPGSFMMGTSAFPLIGLSLCDILPLYLTLCSGIFDLSEREAAQ